jgi:F1F0 ATPase subunit 2
MMASLSILLAGVTLGMLYFGGLWLTVRIAVRRRNPGIIRISHGSRLLGLGAGLVLIGATAPRTVTIAMIGVIGARMVLMVLAGRTSHVA